MAQLQELSRLTTAKALHGFTPQEEANLRDYLIRISTIWESLQQITA